VNSMHVNLTGLLFVRPEQRRRITFVPRSSEYEMAALASLHSVDIPCYLVQARREAQCLRSIC